MAKILANYGGLLMAAMGQTLLLALYGLFFACIIGLVVGLMSVVKNRACNIIATIFVDIIRGVPMIVLAFYVFFAVPMLLNNILHLNTMLGLSGSITLSGLQAGTICLALNCGANKAENIRAGIESRDTRFHHQPVYHHAEGYLDPVGYWLPRAGQHRQERGWHHDERVSGVEHCGHYVSGGYHTAVPPCQACREEAQPWPSIRTM